MMRAPSPRRRVLRLPHGQGSEANSKRLGDHLLVERGAEGPVAPKKDAAPSSLLTAFTKPAGAASRFSNIARACSTKGWVRSAVVVRASQARASSNRGSSMFDWALPEKSLVTRSRAFSHDIND